jgi:hypothetical protein
MKGRLGVLVVFMLGAAVYALAGAFEESGGYLAAGYGFGALFFASLALGRLQIREEGIWIVYRLVKWRDLTAYDWDPEDDTPLVTITCSRSRRRWAAGCGSDWNYRSHRIRMATSGVPIEF